MADQGKVGRCVIRLVYVHPSVKKDLISATSERGFAVKIKSHLFMTRFAVDTGQRYGHKLVDFDFKNLCF